MKRYTRHLVVAGVAASAFAALYVFAGFRYAGLCGVERDSCLEHRKAGCSISGTYDVRVGGRPMEAVCDMKTDGGGWTLVGNYLHSGTGGEALALSDRLPLEGSSSLGQDESANRVTWGHASPVLLSSLSYGEVRFNCRSSAHARVLDLAVSGPGCLQYLRSGKGSCAESPEERAEFARSTRTLGDHNAMLPAVVEKGWKDQGVNALANFPFFKDWQAHWSIGAAKRWECDNYDPAARNSTHHQIWVR